MNTTTEDRKRSSSSKGNGWLATLGGAALLVAVGFGVGLVAGTAYEEPELVASHLSGKTTEVVLGPVGDGQPQPSAADDVAAAPPAAPAPANEPDPAAAEAPAPPLGAGALEDAPAHPLVTAAHVAATAPSAPSALASKPVVKPAAAGSGFSIQVGAFGSESTAKQLAGELGKRGYKTFVTTEGGGARYKVRVGPIASRSEAERLSAKLKSENRLPTWILASGK